VSLSLSLFLIPGKFLHYNRIINGEWLEKNSQYSDRLWVGKLRNGIRFLAGPGEYSSPEGPNRLWGPSSLLQNW
jgi:hypothetical protein